MLTNTKKYNWVKKEVKKSVKSGHLVLALGEFGHEVSLAYQAPNGNRMGVFLRSDARVFDINDLSEENKADFIATIVCKFNEAQVNSIDIVLKNGKAIVPTGSLIRSVTLQ